MAGESYANADALVSADWLAQHLDDPRVRVVEIDVSPKSYGEGHIAGAVFWDIYADLKDRRYRLVDGPAFERIVRASGIAPDTTVVCYGYGAVFGYWLLRLYRHPHVAVLNAAKTRWHDEGRPESVERPTVPPTTYALPAPDGELRASQAMVAAAIGAPESALLDVRSDAEFRGERFWPSGAPAENGRAGHIPGAVHIVPDAFITADGSFASPAALRAVFPAALDGAANLVTYCTIGNRASVAWFVLTELLGRRGVRVYDGSWAEWGFMPDTQVAT